VPHSVTELVLVRHGETDWNAQGRIQGQLDIPLNPVGLAQAAAVGARLRDQHFDAIYASDLERAMQTARPVVQDDELAIRREPRLRERHFGVLQGLTGEEAKRQQSQVWQDYKARGPKADLGGGESLLVFSRRVVDFIDQVLRAHAGGRVLLVSHGGVLDMAYRHASGMPLGAQRDFPIYNASLNILLRNGARWEIAAWGDISHLPQELAMDDT
jgi:probable phosphoglycerate mutase